MDLMHRSNHTLRWQHCHSIVFLYQHNPKETAVIKTHELNGQACKKDHLQSIKNRQTNNRHSREDPCPYLQSTKLTIERKCEIFGLLKESCVVR